jgi:branched-chain amino acid transport system permease protein
LILIPLQTLTNTYFGGEGSGLTYILYGGAILLIARFEPGGLLDLVYRARGLFAKPAPPSEHSRHAA